jgi:serine/threonine protein kinase
LEIKLKGIFYDEKEQEYEVTEHIGSGGFGDVYKTTKKIDNSTWALKTIHSIVNNKQDVKAILNEGRNALKIKNENVIRYIYFHDGTKYNNLPPYIIMEYANGGNLNDFINTNKGSQKHIENPVLILMFRQLINGMKAINTFLVHRDITPRNILLHNGELKITDFGLSKIVNQSTRSSTFKGYGTYAYMPPEAWENKKNTIQMDIYSLGIIFYQLATFNYPYEINDTSDLFENYREAHMTKSPFRLEQYNSEVSINLSQIIMKMLEKSVNDRFHNWGEIEELLAIENYEKETDKDVEELLKMQIKRDEENRSKRLEENKEETKKRDFFKRVKYQIIKSIINPLEKKMNEFNKRYHNGRIKFGEKEIHVPGKFVYLIKFVSEKDIQIYIEGLYDYKFEFQVSPEALIDVPFPTEENLIKRVVPKLKGRKILAWGFLKTSEGKGFNIFLIEKENDIYGEWLILENRNNVSPGRERLPEPFPFEIQEFQKELPHIDAMHRYKSEITELNIKYIIDFFKEL